MLLLYYHTLYICVALCELHYRQVLMHFMMYQK